MADLLDRVDEKGPWHKEIWWPIRIRIHRIREAYWYFKQGIKSLVWYSPAVWKTYTWDYNGVFILLDRHLQLMDKAFRRYRHSDHTHRLEVIRRMRAVIKRLMKADYGMEGCKVWRHIGNWHYGFRSLPIGNFFDTCEKEQYMRAQDMTYLCRMLEKHIWDLWD